MGKCSYFPRYYSFLARTKQHLWLLFIHILISGNQHTLYLYTHCYPDSGILSRRQKATVDKEPALKPDI